MKVISIINKYLIRVGMTPQQSLKAYPLNIRNTTILFILTVQVICNVMYLIDGATNLSEYAESIFLTIMAIGAELNFAFVNWKMAEIFKFIENLDDIVNTRFMNSTLKTIYTQTGEKIKKMSEILDLTLIRMSPVCVIVPTFIGSFVAYYTTDLGTEAFELPFPTMWFPFDVNTPFRYSIAAAIQFVLSVNINISAVCALVIAHAPNLILISTTDDIKYGLNTLNTSARTNESQFKITQEFNQFVHFHSKAKQLAYDFSDIVQFLCIVCFTWSIMSICLSMFAIKIELHEHAPQSVILQSTIMLIWSLILVYIACEFGHKLSTAFEEINDEIGQMNWYKFPQKLWRMMPMIVAAAQQPVRVRVFGSTSCNRGDFKAVVNLGFSYFMVLQQFEN